MKFTANLISVLFHPLLLPTYAFAIIMLSSPFTFGTFQDGLVGKNLLIVFINTFCFPTLAIVLTKQIGLIKSITMPEGRERIVPFLTTGAFYVFAFMVFKKGLGAPYFLYVTILGAAITVFVCFFINIFVKISVHTAGMGSLIALLVFASFATDKNIIPIIALVIIIAGLVGSSRLYLGAHKNGELYFGYLAGFICQMVAFIVS